MTLLTMHRAWRGRGASGGGGGGGGASWRSALRAFPYTPPTGIDAYGVGTVLDTTWNLAGQTGTTHTCTTDAHVTTALAAANPGDRIVISANITAPSGGWTLGNRGTGTIYIVSDYINAGTFERRASVSDWSTLSLAEWAAEVVACRARKSDSYRILDNPTSSSGQDPVFQAIASKSTYWVIAGLELRVNAANALTSNINYGLVRIEYASATGASDAAGRVWLDRCYLHAGPTQNMRRAVGAQGSEIAVTNCVISEVHERGNADVQCIAKWTGAGPLKIINNTLEGASQNLLTGGDYTTLACHPADVEMRANCCVQPTGMLLADAANGSTAWSGIDYRGKTAFESKFCKRMWVEGNVFLHARGVFSYAWVMQTLPQYVGMEYVVTQDAAFRQNRIYSETGGINFTGKGADVVPDNPASRIQVLDLVCTGIASGEVSSIIQGMGEFEWYGVTLDGSGNKAMDIEFAALGNMTIRGFIGPYATYGIFRGGGTEGDVAFDAYASGSGFTASMDNSVLWGTTSGQTSYDGSCKATLVANRAAVGFDNSAGDDWDVTGTYATDKANDTLIRALTSALNIEGYP